VHGFVRTGGRRGFVISPRVAFPVLLVVVIAMFLVFASTDGGVVPDARITGTLIVTVALLLVFGLLALLTRSDGRREAVRQS